MIQEFADALLPTPFNGCKGESLVALRPSGFKVIMGSDLSTPISMPPTTCPGYKCANSFISIITPFAHVTCDPGVSCLLLEEHLFTSMVCKGCLILLTRR